MFVCTYMRFFSGRTIERMLFIIGILEFIHHTTFHLQKYGPSQGTLNTIFRFSSERSNDFSEISYSSETIILNKMTLCGRKTKVRPLAVQKNDVHFLVNGLTDSD
jgi:hypothetical protein